MSVRTMCGSRQSRARGLPRFSFMNNPTTRELFERQGAEPMTSTPEEMLKLINAEYGRFTQAIKLAGLTVQ